MYNGMQFVLLMVIGYLSGSLCSAVIVSRLFGLPDPRTAGSANPGATNVLRLSGKKYALMVLVADMLKGLLPVLLAKTLHASPTTIGFTCFAAVLGHMYPVFFGFKGGKGVATALGAFLGLDFILGVVVIATWLLVINFSRYSSLASIIAIVLAPIYSFIFGNHLTTIPPLIFITMFILYKHGDNITRLMDGQEPKINLDKNTLQEELSAALSEPDIDQNPDDEATPNPVQTNKDAEVKKTSARKNTAKKSPKKPEL